MESRTISTKDPSIKTPYRQIRASQTTDTIVVYQAYSAAIAVPAVQCQKLNAADAFSDSRMTWIKPSWAWMLYRSGYSYKDARQSHILAIHLTHEAFRSLLRKAVLAHGSEGVLDDSNKKTSVRVQWDPERDVWLGKLEYRSIQIGIPGILVPEFVEEIVQIDDVTDKARELKRALDEDSGGALDIEELIKRRLVPEETDFEVDEGLRKMLCMDMKQEHSGTSP